MAKQTHREEVGGERPVSPAGQTCGGDGRTDLQSSRAGSWDGDRHLQHRSGAQGHRATAGCAALPVAASPAPGAAAMGRGTSTLQRHHLCHLLLLVPDGKGREGRGMGPHRWDVGDSFLPILFPVTFKRLAPKHFLIAACFSQRHKGETLTG